MNINNNIVAQNNNLIELAEQYKRKIKSVSQQIFLLDTKKISNGDILCQILGSKNKIYNISFDMNTTNLTYKCNCPDFTIRNKTCKHLYWIGITYLTKIDPLDWNSNDVNAFYDRNNLNFYPNGRNECCAICLENIDYDKELTICCVSQCKNSVHTDCWNSYFKLAKTTSCVYCRYEWMY